MSKEAEKFIGLYEAGKNDWLTKYKDVIAKLMQAYADQAKLKEQPKEVEPSKEYKRKPDLDMSNQFDVHDY